MSGFLPGNMGQDRNKFSTLLMRCAVLSILIAGITASSKSDIPGMDDDIDYDMMAKIIDEGLPQTNKPKEVIIIGAGMAGLSAGYVLKPAGHKVSPISYNDL